MRHEVEAGYTLIDLQQSFILMLIVLLALIFQLVTFQKIKDESINSPGDIIVQLYWEDQNATDLDLWVQSPGDKPVGYSRSSGLFFNLLRDDLGGAYDITGLNEEVAFSRGEPDGEYTVNVHSFSSKPTYPITAKVKVMFRGSVTGSLIDIFSGEHVFTGPNQEFTFVRFHLKNHQLDGTLNFVPKPLRSAVP